MAGPAAGRCLRRSTGPRLRWAPRLSPGRSASTPVPPGTLAGGDDLPAEVRPRHRPFLELAEPHRDIICPLHLGLIQGAFAGLASPVTATELIPFAEPDACVVHLAAAP